LLEDSPVLMKLSSRSPLILLTASLSSVCYLALASNESNQASASMKIVQRLDAPAHKSISGDELAQLSRPKNPALATTITTAPLVLDDDLATSGIDLDLGSDISLDSDLLSTDT